LSVVNRIIEKLFNMKIWAMAGLSLMLGAAACGSSRQGQGSASQGAAAQGPASKNSAEPGQARAIWQTQPLYIDGSDNDWTKPLPYSIREEKVSYSISNDRQNLYVLLMTTNPQEQQKIIQGGMSVWVNTRGDKTNGDAAGIGYPLNDRNDRERQLMEDAQPQRYKDRPVRLEDKQTYGLYGFNKDTTVRQYNYGDSNAIGVAMRMAYNPQGDLIYELSVPLQALYPDHVPGNPYPTQQLAVGIFIEPLPSGTKIPREGGGGGGSGFEFGLGGGVGTFGSGMGLGIGLGHTFGGGGRGRKAGRTLYDEAQIWQVVQLAHR
jgi:hypothetical protein